MARVGTFYAELEEIEAQVAEAEARLKPKDKKIREEAAKARAQAEASAHTAGVAQAPKKKKFAPSESLKKPYSGLWISQITLLKIPHFISRTR